MYRSVISRQALRLGLLLTLVVLAMSACGGGDSGGGGGGEKEAKARHLPWQRKDLRPGEYRTQEFKPSLSFRVGKGWTFAPPQMPDFLQIEQGGKRWLRFTNVQEVYKPGAFNKLVNAPKDLVGWFQHHPYLKTDKPASVTAGGVKGEQFDVVIAEDLLRN